MSDSAPNREAQAARRELSVDADTLARCLTALRRRPSGLFTDIDGTISAIAPTPDAAIVTSAARDALRRLSKRLDYVGVVTGRSADDGSAMIGLPGVIVIGNHGLEWRRGSDRWVHPSAEASMAVLARALADVEARAAAAGLGTGLVFENKRLSASIHYRLAPDPSAARETLRRFAIEAAGRHDLTVTEGRFVIELRPKALVNKGTAIVDLAREHRLAGLAYLGDDLTDVDAFRAMRALRERGEAVTVSIAVLSPETHPSVAEAADVEVTGVDGCLALLEALADALEKDVG